MRKGYITVYLALTLTIMITLITALVESARVNAMHLAIESAADISFHSVLAEYNRQLLEQYDLFYVDMGYGSNNASFSKVLNHLQNYMNHNFSVNDIPALSFYRDFMALSAMSCEAVSATIASDEAGIGLKRQAVEYEKTQIGLGIIENLLKQLEIVKTNRLDSRNIAEERMGVDENINAGIDAFVEKRKEEINAGEDEEKNEIEKIEVIRDNPADIVNAGRNAGILHLVLDPSSISAASADMSNSASKRKLFKGNGRNEEWVYPDSFSEELLFHEYIIEKCSSYTKQLDKARLKYQIEYILEGQGNDTDNLRRVAEKLLLLREVSNVIYLFSDSSKMGEIAALAAGLSLVLMIPELETLIQYSIAFAWAFVESVQDVKILLAKGKVPLLKSSADWNTELSKLTSYQNELSEKSKTNTGLTYLDYLRLLLCLGDRNAISFRLMDIIESDIRQTQGNQNFLLDRCFDSLEAVIYVESRYGYSYSINRKYGY